MAIMKKLFIGFILILFLGILAFDHYKKLWLKSENTTIELAQTSQIPKIPDNPSQPSDTDIYNNDNNTDILPESDKIAAKTSPDQINNKIILEEDFRILTKLSANILKANFSEAKSNIDIIKERESFQDYQSHINIIANLIDIEIKNDLIFPEDQSNFAWMRKIIIVEKINKNEKDVNHFVAEFIEKFIEKSNE
jgi:hypothetical protein